MIKTLYKLILKGILYILLMLVATVVGVIILTRSDYSTPQKPIYTAQQKKAAQEIQKLLIKSGLIKEFAAEGDLQIVYVNRLYWDFNSFERKREILKTLSETNEIQGYTPWIEIRDYTTGEVYAAIKPPLTLKVYK